MWLLGIKPGSSGRTVSPLNCLVITPVLHIDVFCITLYTTHGQGSNTLQFSWSLGTVGPANRESMVVLSKGLHNKRTARRSTHEMETKGGKEILIFQSLLEIHSYPRRQQRERIFSAHKLDGRLKRVRERRGADLDKFDM